VVARGEEPTNIVWLSELCKIRYGGGGEIGRLIFRLLPLVFPAAVPRHRLQWNRLKFTSRQYIADPRFEALFIGSSNISAPCPIAVKIQLPCHVLLDLAHDLNVSGLFSSAIDSAGDTRDGRGKRCPEGRGMISAESHRPLRSEAVGIWHPGLESGEVGYNEGVG